MRFVRFLLTIFSVSWLLVSCESVDPAGAQQLEYRRLSIATEPAGDYYVGRRFHIEKTHFWGYMRRPGQSWDSARLVVLNEQRMNQPDRYPESPLSGSRSYGDDHNHEYRLWGNFSGRKVYDPNSNLMLPEFVLQRWELKNASPGWLFKPGEKFNGRQLLRAEPGANPNAL
jgi:hypothetical protein